MSVILFVVFWIVTAGIIALVIGGMIFHFFTVGSIFAIASQRMKQQLAESSPKDCAFCGAQIPPGESKCPGCGAPRDAAAK
jgi:hypothetical protein